MNLCLNCNKETANPKFCSRSCSATVTNREHPKKIRTRVCRVCTNLVMHSRTVFCEEHFYERKTSETYKKMTLEDYRNTISVAGKHPSWVHAHIRNFARSWLKHLKTLPCASCGYDKHVELAHIKALSSFPDSALLGEVNSEDNIIQLCPNCHWEFDNLPREDKLFSRLLKD